MTGPTRSIALCYRFCAHRRSRTDDPSRHNAARHERIARSGPADPGHPDGRRRADAPAAASAELFADRGHRIVRRRLLRQPCAGRCGAAAGDLRFRHGARPIAGRAVPCHYFDRKEYLDYFLSPQSFAIYACIALSVVLGFGLRSKVNGARVLGYSLAGSVLFFVVTNFAVWLTATPLGGNPACTSGLLPATWQRFRSSSGPYSARCSTRRCCSAASRCCDGSCRRCARKRYSAQV